MIATCPHCQARYRLDASRLKGGRGRLKCAKCGDIFPVDAPAAAEAPAEPAPPTATGASASAAEQPAAVKRLLDASKADPGSQRSLAVAVVGCEPGPFRERLVSVLARAGVRTLTSDDGPTCLDMAKRTRPKLVIAASYLPGLTGPELATALRGEPALVGTRTVLLAATGSSAPPPGAVDADLVLDSGEAAERLGAHLAQLLGTDALEGELSDDDEKRLGRQARIAVNELELYEDGSSDRASRRADIEATRDWIASQWPSCADRARALFDAELEKGGF